MTADWWAAFGPAETTVSCGGGTHTVRWAEGRLHALQHPDAEGELVLAALGGGATPCLELIQAWGKHSDDAAVLALGPRSADDVLTLTAAALDEMSSATSGPGWASYPAARSSVRAFSSRHKSGGGSSSGSSFITRHISSGGGFAGGGSGAQNLVHGWASPLSVPLRARARMGRTHGEPDPARGELLSLLALGSPFQFRLSGAVAHTWSDDGVHASRRRQAAPALTAALTGRLAPAVAQWIGVDPGQVDVSIHDGAGWGEIELAPTAGERRLQARLPIGWLAAVWAPGLAVVGGHLVVSVRQARWPAADVLAVSAPGRAPVELSVRRDGEGWTMTGGSGRGQ